MLINLWFFFLNNLVKKFINKFKFLCLNWKVFLFFVFCLIYLLCFIVRWFFNFGFLSFVILILFILWVICLKCLIFLRLFVLIKRFCLFWLILLIVIIFIFNIFNKLDILFKRFGLLILILYFRYYFFFFVIVMVNFIFCLINKLWFIVIFIL